MIDLRVWRDEDGLSIDLDCMCDPDGVVLMTARGARHLMDWDRCGAFGMTFTCGRCDQAWALTGTIDHTGQLDVEAVPSLDGPWLELTNAGTENGRIPNLVFRPGAKQAG